MKTRLTGGPWAAALLAVMISMMAVQETARADDSSIIAKLGLFTKAPMAGDPGIPAGKHASITTKDGEIVIELYPDVAPNTVANFKALAAKGYYDSLKFHRVIPGFMAQGGDPFGTGMGGPGYSVKAEFSKLPHMRGTVAMARGEDPDSAGSQFYICFQPKPQLDGRYTIFGHVVRGMDVVDKIRIGTIMEKVRVLP